MKYKDADFSKWDQWPSEDVFADWVAMRKEKRAKTTQTALNRSAKWVNLLFQRGYSSDITLSIACDNGWQGVEWVYNSEQRKGFPEGLPVATGNVTVINRGTRDLSMIEMIHDKSWAD
jgi:hypothetical protein